MFDSKQIVLENFANMREQPEDQPSGEERAPSVQRRVIAAIVGGMRATWNAIRTSVEATPASTAPLSNTGDVSQEQRDTVPHYTRALGAAAVLRMLEEEFFYLPDNTAITDLRAMIINDRPLARFIDDTLRQKNMNGELTIGEWKDALRRVMRRKK
jgi:hypothetical protein